MQLPNNAKGLLALACVAFGEGDHDTAGELFAQSMVLNDSEDLVNELLGGTATLQALSTSLDLDVDEENDSDMALASAAASLTLGMKSKFRETLKATHVSESFDELDDDEFDDSDEEFDDSDDDYLEDLSDDDSDIDSDIESTSSMFKNVKSPISLS